MMNSPHPFISFIRKFWISITICILILVLCFMSTESLPKTTITNMDKYVHFLMFLGLSGAVFFDNTRYLRQAVGWQRIFWGSFLFPALMGGLIEIVQLFLSYRSGDWWDFFWDGVGAMTGFWIGWLINRWIKSHINKTVPKVNRTFETVS